MRKTPGAVALWIAVLLATPPVRAAEKNYDSDISVWVKGGIKPGPLSGKDIFISVVPGLNLQRFTVPVDLCAGDCEAGEHFLKLNCGMGNEFHITVKDVAHTYLGVSCGWPNDGADPPQYIAVTVPHAEKYEAAVRLDIPTDIQKNLDKHKKIIETVVPTAAITAFTSIIQDLGGGMDCTKHNTTPQPKGGPRRLSIQTFSSPHIGIGNGLMGDRSLCISVRPQGAGIERLTISGSVYGIRGEESFFIGSFLCEHGAALQEGEEYRVLDASCNIAPQPPGLTGYSGPLRVRMTAQISSPKAGDSRRQNVPIQAYPPKGLKN